jgi:hypothetical protein
VRRSRSKNAKSAKTSKLILSSLGLCGRGNCILFVTDYKQVFIGKMHRSNGLCTVNDGNEDVE